MNSTKRFIAEEIAYMFQKFEQTVLKFAQASDERKSHAVEEKTRKKKKKIKEIIRNWVKMKIFDRFQKP